MLDRTLHSSLLSVSMFCSDFCSSLLVSLLPSQLLSELGCFSSVAEIQPTIQKKNDCRLAPFEEVEARRQMFSSRSSGSRVGRRDRMWGRLAFGRYVMLQDGSKIFQISLFSNLIDIAILDDVCRLQREIFPYYFQRWSHVLKPQKLAQMFPHCALCHEVLSKATLLLHEFFE